jgi:hypothetical protein
MISNKERNTLRTFANQLLKHVDDPKACAETLCKQMHATANLIEADRRREANGEAPPIVPRVLSIGGASTTVKVPAR